MFCLLSQDCTLIKLLPVMAKKQGSIDDLQLSEMFTEDSQQAHRDVRNRHNVVEYLEVLDTVECILLICAFGILMHTRA